MSLHWPKRIGADATTMRVTGSPSFVAGGRTSGMLDQPCGRTSVTPACPTRCWPSPPSIASAARRTSAFTALSTAAACVEVRARPWGEREVPYRNAIEKFRASLSRLCDESEEPSVDLREQRLQVEGRVVHR